MHGNDEDIEEIEETPFEKAERQHALVRDKNDRQYCARLLRDTKKKDGVLPAVGDKLFVRPERGLNQGRGRAGVRFAPNVQTQVEVVDADRLADLRASGRTNVVSVVGACEILADQALNVALTGTIERNNEELRAENERLASELAAARERMRKLEDDRKAVTQAQRNAPPSTDGRATRLPAAEKAAAARGTTATAVSTAPEPGTEFGAETEKK